jgi:peptide/nickel transport system permease protein
MPDWDERPQEDRDVYGQAWTTIPEEVDARRTEEVVEEAVEEETKPLGLWADTWRRLRRNKLALVGLGIIIVFIVIGATETLFYQMHWHVRASQEVTQATEQAKKRGVSPPAGYLAPYDPNQVNYSLSPQGLGSPPSWSHPFGTDYLGRDVLSRTLVATRVAMLVGIIAVAIALAIGLLLGPVSGYYGGAVDSVIMRAADIFFAFPYILFVLLIMSVLGQGFQNVFIAIGVLGWATFARVVRGQILSVKSMEYVEAARAQGATDMRIIFRHVLPNSMAPVYVAVAMAIGGAIATEAALSYLGIGVQPPNSSWGLMISESVNYLAGGNWWWLLFPSIALVTTVFGFISFGNGLRDATDPKLKE